MAQLLNTPAPDPGRISQILPSVKCSSCNQPVPIAELGEHVCQPVPPVPNIRVPMSPLSAVALLPQKYQNLVSFPRSNTPQSQHPTSPRQGSPLNAQRANGSGTSAQQPRARAPSTASAFSVRSNDSRRDPTPSQSSRGGASELPRALFPVRPGPSEPPRIPSPLAGPGFSTPSQVPFPTTPRSPSLTSRSPTPGRPHPPSSSSSAPRPRAPSSSSMRPGTIRQPAQSSPAPFSSHAVPPPSPASGMFPPVRSRTATNASSPPGFDEEPEVFYSTGGPSAKPLRARAPSNASLQVRPSFEQRSRAPSNASLQPSHQQHPPMPSPSGLQTPYQQRARAPSAASHMSTASSYVGPPLPEIDTKIGGAAGMAGVGRRGFAAAARAAMFAMPTGHENFGEEPDMTPRQGMDGRRPNAPRFLDIASATNLASSNTPPLSAGSGTSSLSPRSPLSQKSPLSAGSAGIPSPLSRTHPSTPISPSSAPVIASPVSPMGSTLHRERVVPPAPEPPKTSLPALPATPTTPSAASIRLPFFEKFKNKLPEVETSNPEPELVNDTQLPSSPRSESEYGGLAYADSDAEEDEVTRANTATPQPSSVTGTVRPDDRKTPTGKNKIRFPSVANSESQYSESSPVSPRLPMRSLSASTGSSAYSARSAAKSTGALDRVMETLLEDPASPSASSISSPALFPLPLAPDGHRDSKPPKLPMRSHTSPTLGASKHDSARGKKRPKVRVCVRCEKTIDDGRWIQMDGGSVLCDKCWKNMYLPKCRRCNLTIEKQAVSSSDGQLKGKYHRECFDCNTCHKPFPDKSFYVFDGKPFCAYHYHEANNSLCAAATCGQPIEGPCAVSHSGQRYHPEHLLCEYPRCAERLVEYYELDGRMLCERHVHMVGEDADEGEGEDDIVAGGRDSIARAMKRVTRFIDLAGLGGSELR
ncbi:hypothetical protein AcV7_008536 [Taiwanofungus camphoratus]|nr:hypothetical protein AcV7_008536 [Antrodia cinnamomea]